jgi:type IV secretion system protein VirB2
MNLIRNKARLCRELGTVATLVWASCLQLHAASAGGGLPWEKPMQLIASSITGPVAYGVGLLGIAFAGYHVLFGHELSEMGRKGATLGLGVSTLVFAAPMLASAFGVAGALV